MAIATLTLNPAIDKSAVVAQVVPERKLRCRAVNFEPGGGGINVARVLTRLGAEVKAYYPAGGPPAQLLATLLEQEKVRFHSMQIEGWTRQSLAVYESASSQQFRFNMPGPRLREKEWRDVLDTLGRLDPPVEFLVASGSLPPGVPSDFYARLARRCAKNGTRLVLDTSGEALRLALKEEGLFLIKPNLQELRDLVDEELEEEENQERAVESLIDAE
ncbi:MAG: PfkB family carbohydrate kinase, partial [Desulfobacterales bacterium]